MTTMLRRMLPLPLNGDEGICWNSEQVTGRVIDNTASDSERCGEWSTTDERAVNKREAMSSNAWGLVDDIN